MLSKNLSKNIRNMHVEIFLCFKIFKTGIIQTFINKDLEKEKVLKLSFILDIFLS